MQIISNLAKLEIKIAECNYVLTHQSDDAMRHLFNTFRMDFSKQAPADPFSDAYRQFQMEIYRTIAGKPYLVENERSNFDTAGKVVSPFPYYLQSAWTAGHHLLAIGFMLTKLRVPSRSRILEFGPGWGNTTIELARLGFDVTAVEIDRNFCSLIEARAKQSGVQIRVIEDEFFSAETIEDRYDAVLFFEAFHHCDDHMRLLRALHRVVVPGGRVFLASEPIIENYGVPWGVRMDGEALWAVRNFGWLELGFDEAYFKDALRRTGWHGVKHFCSVVSWASVWALERLEDGADSSVSIMPTRQAASQANSADTARYEKAINELEAVYASTSWRVTRPIRLIKRLISRH